MKALIRRLRNTDLQIIYNIINDAATIYRGRIQEDCYKEPYMPSDELNREIESGVQFYGYFEKGVLVAVMGIQPFSDVTLIRHAYTLTSYQRRGIGTKLISYLLNLAKSSSVLVGTWERASWAIKFYQKHGFKLTSRQETDRLLHKYWNIPQRQVETSVVLELKRL